jgi:hypothetical protein
MPVTSSGIYRVAELLSKGSLKYAVDMLPRISLAITTFLILILPVRAQDPSGMFGIIS